MPGFCPSHAWDDYLTGQGDGEYCPQCCERLPEDEPDIDGDVWEEGFCSKYCREVDDFIRLSALNGIKSTLDHTLCMAYFKSGSTPYDLVLATTETIDDGINAVLDSEGREVFLNRNLDEFIWDGSEFVPVVVLPIDAVVLGPCSFGAKMKTVFMLCRYVVAVLRGTK